MNTYTLPCLDSIDWNKCETQLISQCRWSPNPAPAATVQGLYLKDTALVFRFVSYAKPTRAVNTEPDSAVWEDSCLECFFSFDGKNYVNLEANVNSALRASFGPDRHDRKFLKDMDIPMPVVQAAEIEEGWELVLSIPERGSAPTSTPAVMRLPCPTTPHGIPWKPNLPIFISLNISVM